MNNKQDYCREYKAQDIKKSYSTLQKKETLVSEVYDRAVILPAKRESPNPLPRCGMGGVMDSTGKYVSISAHKSPHMIDYGYVCENPEYCDKTAVYCGYLTDHWGHFLLDCTSRLWFCLNNKDIDEYVFIRNLGNQDTSLKGNIKEFFRLLGILDKIRIITVPIRYKKVYVPELSYVYRCYWTDEFSLPFDRVVEQAMKENKDDAVRTKVFFSRSHFKKALKSEFGLEILDNFFKKNGYAIYWPEELSLSKMIYIIRNAEICAFESGTPPHNMLFARNGQKTIVVEKQSVVNNGQCNVDVIRNLDTTYVDGHYTIYPVVAGYGPFFLAYNEYMARFAKNYRYLPPDSCFLSEKYLKNCLHKYMKAYKNRYVEMLGFESCHHLYASSFCEGNLSSMMVLKPYLCGEKLYSCTQLLRWPVVKTQLRRILRVIRTK